MGARPFSFLGPGIHAAMQADLRSCFAAAVSIAAVFKAVCIVWWPGTLALASLLQHFFEFRPQLHSRVHALIERPSGGIGEATAGLFLYHDLPFFVALPIWWITYGRRTRIRMQRVRLLVGVLAWIFLRVVEIPLVCVMIYYAPRPVLQEAVLVGTLVFASYAAALMAAFGISRMFGWAALMLTIVVGLLEWAGWSVLIGLSNAYIELPESGDLTRPRPSLLVVACIVLLGVGVDVGFWVGRLLLCLMVVGWAVGCRRGPGANSAEERAAVAEGLSSDTVGRLLVWDLAPAMCCPFVIYAYMPWGWLVGVSPGVRFPAVICLLT
jgi:hypothetical protein